MVIPFFPFCRTSRVSMLDMPFCLSAVFRALNRADDKLTLENFFWCPNCSAFKKINSHLIRFSFAKDLCIKREKSETWKSRPQQLRRSWRFSGCVCGLWFQLRKQILSRWQMLKRCRVKSLTFPLHRLSVLLELKRALYQLSRRVFKYKTSSSKRQI